MGFSFPAKLSEIRQFVYFGLTTKHDGKVVATLSESTKKKKRSYLRHTHTHTKRDDTDKNKERKKMYIIQLAMERSRTLAENSLGHVIVLHLPSRRLRQYSQVDALIRAILSASIVSTSSLCTTRGEIDVACI